MFPTPAMPRWSRSSGLIADLPRSCRKSRNQRVVKRGVSGSIPSTRWSGTPARERGRSPFSTRSARSTIAMRPNFRVSEKRTAVPSAKSMTARTNVSSGAPGSRKSSFPVMRSDTMSASSPSSSSTTNFPRRPTPVIWRPTRRVAKCAAGTGSVTRCQKDSNAAIRRPTTSSRSCRAMVSTSGSSGMGRRGQLDARHLVPVGAHAKIHDERDIERVRRQHLIAEDARRLVDGVPRHLDDQLVVHLQHDPCLRLGLREAVVYAPHRDLHDVGRRSLDRHVDGHALGGAADGRVRTRHVGDVPPTAEQRLDVALLDAERLRLDDVAPDLRIALEVLVDEALRLLTRHPHAPGETEVAHPVDDAEVEHLRDITLLARDVVFRNVEAGRG